MRHADMRLHCCAGPSTPAEHTPALLERAAAVPEHLHTRFLHLHLSSTALRHAQAIRGPCCQGSSSHRSFRPSLAQPSPGRSTSLSPSVSVRQPWCVRPTPPPSTPSYFPSIGHSASLSWGH